VLLVVLDTTRMDAVSAYGLASGTTPALDALARDGLLYQWALAPAPWTLPSHATLFTSVGPERHGVGVAGRMVLGRDLPTLAERLGAAGYQTVGWSENPLVGAHVGLARGFDHFGGEHRAASLRGHFPGAHFDVVRAVKEWTEQRRGNESAPFFAFVNLFDPHFPYATHEENSLPDADPAQARPSARPGSAQGIAEAEGMCGRLPDEREMARLRGLYHGEVSAADAKLRQIVALVRAAAPGSLVTVVTADHGELLGEQRLLGHEFSLRGELLRVPLVVHGLPGVAPAVIPAPVGLADIAPSLLGWLGIDVPPAWSPFRLPLTADANPPARALAAVYDDAPPIPPPGFSTEHAAEARRSRRGCSESDGVFGPIASLVRFPYKLVSHERLPAQLYDLRWDPHERSDIAAHEVERTRAMQRELAGWRGRFTASAAPPAAALESESYEALSSLGYLN
jgi:arylsulfatase A-like enzyme